MMIARRFLCLVASMLLADVGLAQERTAAIRVIVEHDGQPVPGAIVAAQGVSVSTGAAGDVTLAVAPGSVTVIVAKAPFPPVETTLTVAPGQTAALEVELAAAEFEESLIVAATRTDRRLEDQPMRVEVIDEEEIQEKTIMTPGDIVMLLNETSGMRVQATSPGLAAASVRIQGMRGRYTQFLSDGLPLFGEVGGLGLSQTPPVDLRRVEIIKGVASSLYGAGAMGGVVNLVSRRPGNEPERDLVVNRSTRGATDLVAFISTPLNEQWGLSLLASANAQTRQDIDHDRWADIPYYMRGILRPRLYWDDGAGRSLFATAGFTTEEREGGTAPDGLLAASGRSYVEALDTTRIDTGAVGQVPVRGSLISARAAFAQQRHRHQFGDAIEPDRHDTAFAEVTWRRAIGTHTLVVGTALEYDAYKPEEHRQFAHSFVVPGVFIQDDIDLNGWVTLSASTRVDRHNRFGTFVSPRISALLKSGAWSSRLSAGTGFSAASVLTEETEAAGVARLVVPAPLRPERGRNVSWDLTRTLGSVTSTVTLFYSRVIDPLTVDKTTTFSLVNAASPTTNAGVEFVSTLKVAPFSVVANYAFIRSREEEDGSRVETALTPRHSAGVDLMWEREGVGRVGFEVYYTGVQRLNDNPYATSSEPYVVLGLLAEKQFGWVRAFINGENLTDVRQTRWQPLVRPRPAADGRVTVDAWAPLEGRVVNGGVRVRF